MTINDPVYAVMVPRQRDGFGEWMNPEFEPLYFTSEGGARQYARQWAEDHNGFATVYKCLPIVDIELQSKRDATFTERPYPQPLP